MNIIDAIQFFCHLMQQSGGGLKGREIATTALIGKGVDKDVVNTISSSVSPEGFLFSSKGDRYVLTCIST